ncbi:signal peptide peptidase SppA [candidate division WOR-3 bacterium]|uniref:Signal peptide peptidase SppA n=1 Tax=candidate division WOR-3 bacterium TaxID=2052148 RepID=A0A937XI30_UNCW3|nr:signal peptide peptidase SppA [candidate division WOR-3 bacterium]
MSRKTVIVLVVVTSSLLALTLGLFLAFAIASSASDLSSLKAWDKGLGYIEIEGAIVDATETVRQLKAHEGNSQVKGILIRVDSPGGVVTPSHEIYEEIRRIRDDGMPIIVSMGTLAASGGYYVSAPASRIVANPQTLTGSIGVIMEFPMLKGVMDKIGVKVEVVKSRVHKDIGSPFRDMTDQDRELLQDVVSDAYDQFVAIVSTERKIPEDSVRAFADGRIMTGRQALALGLVDTLGTFEDAKRIAASLCGIEGEPRLIRPSRRLKSWVLELLEETTEGLVGGFGFPRLRYIYY